MKITTKMRDWKSGEAAETRTLCPEDQQLLCRSVTNAVRDMLKQAGRDALGISVELHVTISEAANPNPPKQKQGDTQEESNGR